MLTVSMDRDRISEHFKATVSVTSDVNITAFEVRATKVGEPYASGEGYDLLSDDSSDFYTVKDGVAYASEPLNSFSFYIEASELAADGEYRISIYVRNSDGIWSDVCQLYTNSSQALVDSSGAYVLVKRLGTGTDCLYTSSYSGEEIDNFISEVLL